MQVDVYLSFQQMPNGLAESFGGFTSFCSITVKIVKLTRENIVFQANKTIDKGQDKTRDGKEFN